MHFANGDVAMVWYAHIIIELHLVANTLTMPFVLQLVSTRMGSVGPVLGATGTQRTLVSTQIRKRVVGNPGKLLFFCVSYAVPTHLRE